MNDITEVDRLNAKIADLKRTIEWYQGRIGITMGAAAQGEIAAHASAPAALDDEAEMLRETWVATEIHYPECWDVAAYPTLNAALSEVFAWFKCSECAPAAAPAPVSGMPDLPRLIELLNAIKPNFGDVGSRDVDVKAQRERIEEAIAILSATPLTAQPFDFHAHLARQAAFSLKTFGPGARTVGVCDHIRKELIEIAAKPDDLMEWVDVVILALDGAWRCGGTPDEIISGIVAKQTKNEGRNWPDWRAADPNKAIEHDRSGESDETAAPGACAK